jgi:DNA-binding response OmpR family regulator
MQELKEKLPAIERMPDLVITDHRLPGGWTARKIVDVISAHMDAEVPVIILTGEVTTSLTEFTEAQVLAKPAAPEALLAAIAASCQRQRDVAQESKVHAAIFPPAIPFGGSLETA